MQLTRLSTVTSTRLQFAGEPSRSKRLPGDAYHTSEVLGSQPNLSAKNKTKVFASRIFLLGVIGTVAAGMFFRNPKGFIKAFRAEYQHHQ